MKAWCWRMGATSWNRFQTVPALGKGQYHSACPADEECDNAGRPYVPSVADLYLVHAR